MEERVVFELDAEELEAFAKQLGEMSDVAKGRDVQDALEEVVEALLRVVDEVVPRWWGTLAGSIDTEVLTSEEETQGVVYSDLIYAPPQERGTDPYWPNIDNLDEWAEEHGTTGYVIARAIANRGLFAREFFQESLRTNAELIVKLLDHAVARVLEVKK